MTSSTGTVVFNDAKLQAIDVVATERLGVGTLDPASNLHVVGNVHVTGNVNKLNFTDGYTIKRGANVTVFGTTDVIQEITGPHARHVVPLRKYPEVAFAEGQFEGNDSTNTYTQGGYTASTSDQNNSTTNAAYGAFDGVSNDINARWRTDNLYVNNESTATPSALDPSSPQTQLDTNTSIGEYLVIKLPSKIKLKNIVVNGPHMHMPYEVDIYGRNESGSTWTHVKNYIYEIPSGTDTSAWNTTNQTIDATQYYLEYAFVVVKTNGHRGASIGELELYGTEETSDPDTSVDTKITSQFNLPDTTGVKLYIDGDKGSTATDFSGEGHTLTENNATYDSAEKAWEFSSLSTSNVTMTSGDLAMDGTHPHSVSLWFNAANVSSNATLFHVGTAAGEGDAKTSISLTESGHLGWIDGGDNQFLSANTWHNLVYATQGGGGVRTCYLDGRKLGDAQVQDTFGEYPPFAMSSYSQYGYTVSANNEFLTDSNNIRPAWGAHNPYYNANASADGGVWMTEFSKYSGSSPYAAIDGDTFTDSDGGTHTGHWNKIEMSHKLVPSYVYFTNGGTYYSVRMATNWVILGSNDDSTWDLLLSSTTTINQSTQSFAIDTSKGYKYLMFLCKNINGDTALFLEHIRFYGHKENDTTRFPVSSTVLKYPHIDVGVPRDNPAKRGYVVTTGSSIYSGRTGARAFDNQPTGDGWETNTSSYDLNNSGVAQTGTDTFGSYTGHWIKLELPRKIVVSSIDINAYWNSSSQADDRRPDAGAFLGSNDDSTWELIHAFGSGTLSWSLSSSSSTTYETNISSMSASNTNAYKYIVFVITHKTYGGSPTVTTNKTSIRRLRYYGTEPEDVVARVGEGLDGKVANFRVYDKYLHEEQALELWDAQKDQFGRAESSVVVHKGRLGVGTTEPEGRFAVLDEAGEMGEFPPRAMTDYETYMDGHGVFKASADRERNTYESWRAFDKSVDFFDNIVDLNGNSADQYEESSGDYIGSATTTTLDAGQIDGSWIQLQIPYKVKLSSFALAPQPKGAIAHFYGASRMPKTGSIVGSNDGVNWYLIGSITKDEYGAGLAHFSMNSTSFYSYFRLIAQTITAGDFSIYRNRLALSQFNLFGTREQGQSTLHDGQLTLTKNLTVPRIGPALDADDTPRRDRLVVEYNTSTNPTANGTVKDTSGRGLDGLIRGSASYDATEKAFNIVSSSDIILTGREIGGVSGDILASVSLWFKGPTLTGGSQILFIHTSAYAARTSFVLNLQANEIRVGHGGTNYTYNAGSWSAGTWNHAVGIKRGYGAIQNDIYDLYLNGVKLALTNATGTSSMILGVDASVIIGSAREVATNTEQFTGEISNVKYYPGLVLTAEEVKTLYDMGRSDEGHHVVNFSKTRVGIGLGDGEAPQAALEVRDQGILSKGYIGGPYNGKTARTCDLVIKQSGDVNDAAKASGVRMFRAANNTNSWHFGVNTGTNLEFLYNNASMAYMGRVNVSALDFTGQHRSFVDGVPHTEYDNLEGLIVSANKNKYYDINEDITRGAHAIQISQSLPLVSLSTEEKDKACFGVISGSEDPESREYSQGSFVSVVQKQKGDRRAFINSVGEGAMWVVNTVGDLESGDYITTSNVAGYGQKQESDSLKNYTVAKITMDCDFNPQDQPIQRIKQSNVVETHYTGLVPVVKGVPHEFVTTTVTADDEWSNVSVSPSDVTYAEWSNLEAKVQNTYTLTYTQTSNVVYDVKYTKTTTANVTAEDAWDAVHIEPPSVTYAEYSNLEANVQNTYSLTYTMTTKVEATEAIYSNLSTEDKEFFVPTYYQLVEQTVDAEYPGAVKHETVTDRLENALDEHGQLQWEDDPSGVTEKAYKIRYLDATGQQTDEANCVHRAAFVGCTYHCG